ALPICKRNGEVASQRDAQLSATHSYLLIDGHTIRREASSAFENDHRRGEPRLMTEAEVDVSHPLAAGLDRRWSRQAHRRTAAVRPDHFDLLKRDAARPARAQGFEQGFL